MLHDMAADPAVRARVREREVIALALTAVRRLEQRTEWARFWEKVSFGFGCWEWRGTRTSSGYGQFWVDGHREVAHRVAWRLVHGTPPTDPDLVLMHDCDNRICVRPGHLRWGSQSENVVDAIKKGRRMYRRAA